MNGMFLVPIHRQDWMYKDLTAMIVMSLLQCEGFVIPMIATETSNDRSMHFNREEAKGTLWESVPQDLGWASCLDHTTNPMGKVPSLNYEGDY